MNGDLGIRVPREREANLCFRRRMIKDGCANPSIAAELREACRRDIIFWVNTFVWTFDPRLKKNPALPFVTYDYQIDVLQELSEIIGVEDIGIEKSRDMGASWMCLIVMDWRWRFYPLQSFLMVSRVEGLVDQTDEPDSLFWKMDFIDKWLPSFLRPVMNRMKLVRANSENGSTITGASTTSETSRGGRKTAILFDEFASVSDGNAMLSASRDATDCRIFNSTPKGVNAFYDVMQTDIKKIRMHWTAHPPKSKGLYTDENGKERSPWYDLQCKRAAHPMEIAQELDIDYLASDYTFFSTDMLDRLQRETVCDPFCQGEAIYDTISGTSDGWLEQRGGATRLWTYIGPDNKPPIGEYVLGIDVATGTGASNSCISIANIATGEKVAEFARPDMDPAAFAVQAIAMAWLFNEGMLIWEANGPGRIFGQRVLDLGYRNIYWRELPGAEESLRYKKTANPIPGWWSQKKSKLAVIGDYRRALDQSLFMNRSREAINEARAYIFTSDGGVVHSRSVNTVDPSGARENHGDRVIADALAWKGIREFNSPDLDLLRDPHPEDVPIPKGVSCYEGRRRHYRDTKNMQEAW